MVRDYKKDIKIPHNGESSLCLYVATKEKIAIGYNRIVFGQRGPYIEFTKEQIIKDAIHIPKNKSWKLLKKYADTIDYIEMRTNACDIKVYFQKKRVDYADYNPGFIYISPFDLYNESGDVIIKQVGAKETNNASNVPIGNQLRKKAQVNSKPKKVKITKKERDFAYNKAYEYLTERFNNVEKINKANFQHFKGRKTLLGTNIQEKDALLQVVVLHTDNLNCEESYIVVHFKMITLRELDTVCKKYYLVKERREPVLVELEYMFNEISRKKIKEEYN